jgi:hypothetical protein
MDRLALANFSFSKFVRRFPLSRGLLFGLLILGALLAFEVFNYSTTDFALTDLLGDLRFAAIRWSTILAIAFCGIDFAGIARLFTPEQGADEPKEVWYLFGAWLLAATMNAMLTWWGVSVALINHQSLGSGVIAQGTLVKVVPIFVAVMVWLIRILIIGTFSVAGDRLFSQADAAQRHQARPAPVLSTSPLQATNRVPTSAPAGFRPIPKVSTSADRSSGYVRSEPTYHPASLSSSKPNNTQTRS